MALRLLSQEKNIKCYDAKKQESFLMDGPFKHNGYIWCHNDAY